MVLCSHKAVHFLLLLNKWINCSYFGIQAEATQFYFLEKGLFTKSSNKWKRFYCWWKNLTLAYLLSHLRILSLVVMLSVKFYDFCILHSIHNFLCLIKGLILFPINAFILQCYSNIKHNFQGENKKNISKVNYLKNIYFSHCEFIFFNVIF